MISNHRLAAWSSCLAWALAAGPAGATEPQLRELTSCCRPREFYAGDPAWTPDGKSIAVTFARDFLNDRMQVGVAVLSLSGEFLWNFVLQDGYSRHADFSPDGTRLVVDHSVQWLTRPTTTAATDGLLVVNRDGSHLIQLTTGKHSMPAWSPDGATIVFESDGQIYRVPAAGGSPTQITPDGGTHPTWSPDGTSIAYASGSGLRIIAANGGIPAPLTTHPTDTDPTWSRDGLYLAFTSRRTGSSNLWIVPARGGLAWQLTAGSADDTQPAWSPDGRSIAFTSNRNGHANVWIATDLPDLTVPVTPTSWSAAKELWR
jgi:Tol biopolymer transport system component